jgi:hypothetical protein
VLKFGEEHLEGIEVRRVLGQEEKLCACCPGGGAERPGAVRSEIVHDDDVAGLEGRREDLFDIEQEALAIDRPLDQPGRHHRLVPPGWDDRRPCHLGVDGLQFLNLNNAIAGRTEVLSDILERVFEIEERLDKIEVAAAAQNDLADMKRGAAPLGAAAEPR